MGRRQPQVIHDGLHSTESIAESTVLAKGRLGLALLVVVFVRIWGASWQTTVALLLIAALHFPSHREDPALYFAWTRLKYRVSNVATTWSLGVRLSGDFSSQAVEQFARQLASDASLQTRILEVSSERVLIHYNRLFTIEFLLSLPDPFEPTTAAEFGTLNVSVLDQQVSYRRSTAMMEDFPNSVYRTVTISVSCQDGALLPASKFEEINPFFGLYVQHSKGMITDSGLSFIYHPHFPANTCALDKINL